MYAGMGASRVIEPTAPPVEFMTEQVTYARMAWYTAEGIDHFTIDGYTLVDIPRRSDGAHGGSTPRTASGSRRRGTHGNADSGTAWTNQSAGSTR